MSDLVERVALAICEDANIERQCRVACPICKVDARAAIAICMEEAARCAEQYAAETWTDPNAADTRGIMRLQAEDIAAAIRALATQP